MNFNFFEWLRDGVRQSVLLGVSDAVEQIGTPETGAEISPELAGLLNESGSGGGATATATATKRKRVARKGAPQKRLGKSLQELNPPA